MEDLVTKRAADECDAPDLAGGILKHFDRATMRVDWRPWQKSGVVYMRGLDGLWWAIGRVPLPPQALNLVD